MESKVCLYGYYTAETVYKNISWWVRSSSLCYRNPAEIPENTGQGCWFYSTPVRCHQSDVHLKCAHVWCVEAVSSETAPIQNPFRTDVMSRDFRGKGQPRDVRAPPSGQNRTLRGFPSKLGFWVNEEKKANGRGVNVVNGQTLSWRR